VVSVEHIGEEDLEQYAMRTIPESACAALVWHLLVCQSCRDRLEATEGYLAAMRSAAAKIRQIRKGIGRCGCRAR
jgi:hypothetical protein